MIWKHSGATKLTWGPCLQHDAMQCALMVGGVHAEGNTLLFTRSCYTYCISLGPVAGMMEQHLAPPVCTAKRLMLCVACFSTPYVSFECVSKWHRSLICHVNLISTFIL